MPSRARRRCFRTALPTADRASRGRKERSLTSMQRRATPLVDALQEPERPEADRAVRQRVAEVLDDVERDGHVKAGEHARGALGIDARDDRIELAVHEVDA